MMSTLPCAGVVASLMRPEMTAASDINCLPQHREIQIERSSLLMRTFDMNFASVFVNDSVRHGKPKASAPFSVLRCGLGCEKRIVNPMNVFLRDSGTRVGHNNMNAVAVGGRDLQRS